MFVVHFKPDRNHSAADAFVWADCWVVFEESIQPLAPWHPCVAVGDILFSKLLLLWSGFTPTSHQPGIGSAPECAPADRAKGELPRRELALEKVILRVPMNTCEYLSLSLLFWFVSMPSKYISSLHGPACSLAGPAWSWLASMAQRLLWVVAWMAVVAASMELTRETSAAQLMGLRGSSNLSTSMASDSLQTTSDALEIHCLLHLAVTGVSRLKK